MVDDMTLLERLRAMVEAAPPGSLVSIPRDWLADELQLSSPPAVDGDLTISQVSARIGRAPSTVRGWLERGELNGYRFRGREWRIPPAALQEFVERERGTSPRSPARSAIADWRSVGKNATVGPTKTGGVR
jgi:excisionase family DNA binding protein